MAEKVQMEQDNAIVIVNNCNIAKYEGWGWKVSEKQPVSEQSEEAPVDKPKDESVLENADELKAEEAAGEKIDAPETADEKSEVIPPEAIVEDEVIMPAESK